MKIAVRKADGYVLNSYKFNSELSNISEDVDFRPEEFDAEDYDVYEVDDPKDEEKEFLYKRYFYTNNQLNCVYYVNSKLQNKIDELKKELSSTDYIIVKASEQSLLGNNVPTQYNYKEVSVNRQELRNEINRLEELKEKYPFVSMYKREYLKTPEHDKK